MPDAATMGSLPIEGSRKSLEIGCYVVYGVSMLVVLFRLYARAFVVRRFGFDDYFIIGGVLSATAGIVTVPIMFSYSIGLHKATLSEHQILYGRKAAWISQIFYFLGLGFIKCSIVALYCRLVSTPLHRRILYVLGGLVMANGLISAIVTSTMCIPLSVIWSPSFPRGCMDILAFNYFSAAFNILTDVLLAVLPIPVLATLRLSRKRKIALATVFGAGVLTIAATITRQVYNFKTFKDADYSWDWAPTELTSNLELSMALIFASIPAIQAFYKTKFGTTYASSRTDTYCPPTQSTATAKGFEFHSGGRDRGSKDVHWKGSTSSKEAIIGKASDAELGFASVQEPRSARLAKGPRSETTIVTGDQTDDDGIQLTNMHTRNHAGVMKSVDFRVDYSRK